MLIRTISGAVGLALVWLAFTWPQYFFAPSDTLINTGSGFLTAAIVTIGVYLMFYGLTGDWLPNFRKPKNDT